MSPILTVRPDWEAIKLAAVRGVPDKTIAEAFGVTREAIRKRRQRSRWPGGKKKTPSQAPESRSLVASAEAAGALATVSLAEIGERNALLIAREVGKLIQRTFAKGLLPAPATWSELTGANKLMESATGRNRTGGVSVNVGMAWSSNPYRGEKPIIVLKTE